MYTRAPTSGLPPTSTSPPIVVSPLGWVESNPGGRVGSGDGIIWSLLGAEGLGIGVLLELLGGGVGVSVATAVGVLVDGTNGIDEVVGVAVGVTVAVGVAVGVTVGVSDAAYVGIFVGVSCAMTRSPMQ